MTTNEFVATATTAATKLQEAGRDATAALLNAGLEGQERALRLARVWVDETQSATEQQKQLLETVGAQVQKTQDAAITLAQTYAAAGVAGLYFPFALAEQLGRAGSN